ncbi:hypothetical protein [Cellulomonas cellasea]|uniref:Uncharacterized protein n=1 Tax=Cellulomonas cellasea TaxID=43670 RepID=A0A7W4UG24_9CELL|nr:hypothetical protein [Cellulomonas cellasea]MBB2923536.1 hypothetical protein [Cellulomonas cellasea]
MTSGDPSRPPFGFDERVVVLRPSSDGRVLPGDEGEVVGTGDDVDGVDYYAVFVERLRIVHTFRGSDLARSRAPGGQPPPPAVMPDEARRTVRADEQ